MLASAYDKEQSEQEATPIAESKVTVRGQTTLPKAVCEALRVTPGVDRIAYQILSGGRVLLVRHEHEEPDNAMAAFLNFIERDIERNPSHVKPLDMDLFARGAALVAGMDVDLNEELTFDDKDASDRDEENH